MRGPAVGLLVAVGIALGATSASARMSFDGAGHFLINGQPRFVLGVYDTGLNWYTAQSDWENAIFTPGGDIWGTRALANTPINVYLNYQQGADTTTQFLSLLDALGAHGALGLGTSNCFTDRSYTAYSFSVDGSPAGAWAQTVAAHPAMAGYYLMDECSDQSYGAVDLVPETQTHHATIKGYDPQAINMAVPIAHGYRDPIYWTAPASGGPTADLFGTDPYPLYGAEPSTGYGHFTVADYIARLRSDVPASQPVVAVLQLFKFTSNGRLPSYSEMRMHAYSAIVEGAQGLFWWEIGVNGLRGNGSSAADVATWMGYLQTLVQELHGIEPALVAPSTPSLLVGNSSSIGDPVQWRKNAIARDMQIVQPISYSEYQWYQAELNALNAGDTSLSPMLHQASPQSGNIRTRASVANGYGWLIAYNYTNQPATVTFTWQSAPTAVTVVGEGRSLAPSGASFTDSFGAYEAHVYQISAPVASSGASMGSTGADSATVGSASPAVTSWQPGRLDVFMRGPDNTLRHRFFAGSWSDWENLGGTILSDPGVASWGAGRIDLVVRGADNAVWHVFYDGKVWAPWESLGGETFDRPMISSWGPGRLDVVIRGTDNKVWHRFYDGRWSTWESLGGAVASAPAAVSFAFGRVDLFAQGLDNALYHKVYLGGGGWSDWSRGGGSLVAAPAAASWGDGRMDVFVRGTDGTLWHQWFDSAITSGRWEGLGDAITTAPAAVSWGSSRIDLFAGRGDGTLLHRWYDGGWSSEVMAGPR